MSDTIKALGICTFAIVMALIFAAIWPGGSPDRSGDITTLSLEQQWAEVEELQAQYLQAHHDYLKNQRRANQALGLYGTDLDHEGTLYVSPSGCGVVEKWDN